LKKIKHTFVTKAVKKQGIKDTFLNIIKVIYENLESILNREKLKPFLLESGMRQQGCPLSQLLFNIVLEFLTKATRQ
jgi:hypothetical protein